MVTVSTLTGPVLESLTHRMPVYHREADIFQYQFEAIDDPELRINSAWLLTFFENKKFIGTVKRPDDEMRAR